MPIKRPELEDISNEYQNIECKFIRNFGKEDIYWFYYLLLLVFSPWAGLGRE